MTTESRHSNGVAYSTLHRVCTSLPSGNAHLCCRNCGALSIAAEEGVIVCQFEVECRGVAATFNDVELLVAVMIKL
jgi:hypothetical protein